MREELDPYGAFVDLAVQPDESHPSGPRLAVKDMIAVAGLRRTCGLPARADDRPLEDAPVVAAFRRAGYRIVGTTATDNAGFGTMTDQTRNPRHPELAAGGSSGGSAAAVAAGLADVGLGTDTGGSVRIPAAYCELMSLKPSHGRVDMGGIVPLAPQFDVAGIMTRDAGALRAAASILVGGWREADDTPARFTHAANAVEMADPVVARAFAHVLERLPESEAKRDPFPFLPMAEAHSVIVCTEGLRVHAAEWRRDPRGFPPTAAAGLAEGERLTDRDVARASAVVEEARRAWRSAMADDEIMIQPTLPMPPAPRHASTTMIGSERHPITNANIRLCIAANVAGLPVVVAPVAGLSVQFTAAPRRDEWLLATVLSLLSPA